MAQLSIHNTFSFNPPPQGLPILQKLVQAYKLWHSFLPHFPKTSRYTLGTKIDSLFVEIIELLFVAEYLKKQEKIPFVQKASKRLDLLKFFLQVSWEIKALDNKKYITISECLDSIGKDMGGWIKQLFRGLERNRPST